MLVYLMRARENNQIWNSTSSLPTFFNNSAHVINSSNLGLVTEARESIEFYQQRIDQLEEQINLIENPPFFGNKKRGILSLGELSRDASGKPFQTTRTDAKRRAEVNIADIDDYLSKFNDTLPGLLAFVTRFKMSNVVDEVIKCAVENGTVEEIPSISAIVEDKLQEWREEHTKPEWVVCIVFSSYEVNPLLQQLLFKLHAKIPDKAYQQGLLDMLELGSGKKSDAQLLLTKHKMKAVQHAFNYIIEQEFEFGDLPNNVKGIQCRLQKVQFTSGANILIFEYR